MYELKSLVFVCLPFWLLIKIELLPNVTRGYFQRAWVPCECILHFICIYKRSHAVIMTRIKAWSNVFADLRFCRLKAQQLCISFFSPSIFLHITIWSALAPLWYDIERSLWKDDLKKIKCQKKERSMVLLIILLSPQYNDLIPTRPFVQYKNRELPGDWGQISSPWLQFWKEPTGVY